MKKDNTLRFAIICDCVKSTYTAVLFYLLNNILKGILSIFTANIFGNFTDNIFELNVAYGFSNLWKLLLCVGITCLVFPLLGMIGETTFLSNYLKYERFVYSRFLDKSYESKEKIDKGEAQYRFEQDPSNMCYIFIEIIAKMMYIPLVLSLLLYCYLKISGLFTLIIFLVSTIKLAIPIGLRKIQAKYDKKTREYYTEVRNMETQIIDRPFVIKLFGLSEGLIDKLDKKFQSFFNSILDKSIKYTETANSASKFIDTFCVLLILLIGSILISVGTLTVGNLSAMIGYFSLFNLLLEDITYIISNITILINIVDRMEILYAGAEDLTGKTLENISLITVSDLSFQYNGNTNIKYKDASIELKHKVAICGENGSGKSTLLKLLSGLLASYKGSLQLDGVEINSISVKSLRDQLALVSQEPFLFVGSVQENILLGNLNANEARIKNIMNSVGISHLFDRKITSQADNLSGGEKQKISIARALIKDVPLLLLDEPSNNLDEETKEWLKDFIVGSSKTILYVSHDDYLLEAADVILYL